MARRYWIGVASKDHVDTGVEGGFAQVCHGKKAPLDRMQPGDTIFYYSPKVTFEGKERLQCFTAIGKVVGQETYSVQMGANFFPFRRDIEFYTNINPAPLKPLIHRLDFIDDKTHYGAKFRFGHFEISQKDAMTIWHAMKITNDKDI